MSRIGVPRLSRLHERSGRGLVDGCGGRSFRRRRRGERAAEGDEEREEERGSSLVEDEEPRGRWDGS